MNQMYINQEKFIDGYIECALWSSTMGDDIGTPMDETYSVEDFSLDVIEVMRADCCDFFEANIGLLGWYCDTQPWDYAGHDFWLTRNGHGAGFWDRGMGQVGELLSDVARLAGPRDLYIGDDQEIHQL